MLAIAVVGAEISGSVIDLSQTHSALLIPWSGSAFCMVHEGADAVGAVGVVDAVDMVDPVDIRLESSVRGAIETVIGVIDEEGSWNVEGSWLNERDAV